MGSVSLHTRERLQRTWQGCAALRKQLLPFVSSHISFALVENEALSVFSCGNPEFSELERLGRFTIYKYADGLKFNGCMSFWLLLIAFEKDLP